MAVAAHILAAAGAVVVAGSTAGTEAVVDTEVAGTGVADNTVPAAGVVEVH